jgi:hypothetical protein
MVINSSDKSPFEIRDSTGKEFKEIYDNQGRLLFKNWDEIQGSPPITFRGYGKNLTECRIYGNTVQNGTPSPDVPVDVVGCGVRTGNLFDPNSTRYHMGKGANNKIGRVDNGAMFYIKAVPNTKYTIKIHATDSTFVRLYLSNAPIVEGVAESYNVISESETVINPEVTITNTEYAYLWIQTGGTWYTEHGGSSIMLNTGSTPLPYEPYGYKIPVTVSDGTNTVTTPVYIGNEPLHKIGDYADYVDFKRGVVVRRIKKLVLTGAEPDLMVESSSFFYLNNPIKNAKKPHRVYSSHFMGGDKLYNNNTVTISNTGRLNFATTDIPHSVAEFASFLAQQYEAGTPVTIWYVLAEPEEEPLENLLPIQTIRDTNILTADTTIQPSEMYLKGKIKPVT